MHQQIWFSEDHLTRLFFSLEHEVPWCQGVTFRGLHLKDLGHAWRGVLKGVEDGCSVVAFFKAPTFGALLLHIAQMVESDCIVWHRDRFP